MGKKKHKNGWDGEGVNIFEDPLAVLQAVDSSYDEPCENIHIPELDQVIAEQIRNTPGFDAYEQRQDKKKKPNDSIQDFMHMMDKKPSKKEKEPEVTHTVPPFTQAVTGTPIDPADLKTATLKADHTAIDTAKTVRVSPIDPVKLSVRAELVKELGRVIFYDKMTSCSYHLSFMDTLDYDMSCIDFTPSGADVDESQDEKIITEKDLAADLFMLLIVTSVPTAVYTLQEFQDEFKFYNKIDLTKFIFAGYGDYIFVWIIDASLSKLILEEIPDSLGWGDSTASVLMMLLGMSRTKLMLNNVCNVFDESVSNMLYMYCNNDKAALEKIIENDPGTEYGSPVRTKDDIESLIDQMMVIDLDEFYDKIRMVMDKINGYDDDMDDSYADDYDEDEDDEDAYEEEDEEIPEFHIDGEASSVAEEVPKDYDPFGFGTVACTTEEDTGTTTSELEQEHDAFGAFASIPVMKKP